jgi:serine/threonine-protein kinase
VRKIGRIQIFAEIKHGENSSTYRGMDLASQQLVLVKTFSRCGDGTGSRFAQEAAIYAQINHPNVVRLLEYGMADEAPFLALEFVEGQNLRTLLQHSASDRSLPLEVAIAIFYGILEGVEEIHQKNFIHRDLKPENILIANNGRVKICDFDLAIHEDARNSSGLTGSAGYVAPEAVLGEKITAAADLFALGILFYEMLAGARPFQARSASGEMNAIVRLAHLPLSKINHQVPPLLDELLDRLLAKKTTERPKKAREILQWLTTHFETGATEARCEIVRKYVAAPLAYQPVGLVAKSRSEKWPQKKSLLHKRFRAVAWGTIFLIAAATALWQMIPPNRGIVVEPVPSVSKPRAHQENAVLHHEQISASEKKRENQVVPKPAEDDARQSRSDRVATLGESASGSGATRLSSPKSSPTDSMPPISRAVRIRSNPWAYFFIDGDSIGVTPRYEPVSLLEGEHELILKNPEFPSIKYSLQIDATISDMLYFSLWERVAQLELYITPWAEIFVDGERQELPPGRRLMILPPGKYTLRFVHPELGEKTETVFLRAGEARRLEINMF